MKIYQLTAAALFAVAVMTITSCSNDIVTAGEQKTEADIQKMAQPTLVFNFKAPAGDPLVYAHTRTQTDEEAAISSLYMFEVDAATMTLASDPVDIFSSLTGSNPTFTYTPATANTSSNGRMYYFIANDNIQNSSTSTDFEEGDAWSAVLAELATKKITTQTSATNYWTGTDPFYLPMTGVGVFEGNEVIRFDISKDQTYTVNVDLNRIVSRIDVINNTPKLEITELKIVNANDVSYILPNKTNSGFDIPALTTASGPRSRVTITPYQDYDEQDGMSGGEKFMPALYDDADYALDNSVTVGNVKTAATLSQAFYVYEDARFTPADETEPLRLQVIGTLNSGVAVTYDIPFMDKYVDGAAGTETTSLALERNHRYTVTIGDGTPVNFESRAQVRIQVKDWDAKDVTDTFDDNIFVFTTDNTTDPSPYSYEKATRTLTIPATGTSSDVNTIKIDDAYSSANATLLAASKNLVVADDAGATANGIEIVSGNDGNWATITKDADGFTIVASANSTGSARSVSVRMTYYIKSDLDDGTPSAPYKFIFHIVQPAS